MRKAPNPSARSELRFVSDSNSDLDWLLRRGILVRLLEKILYCLNFLATCVVCRPKDLSTFLSCMRSLMPRTAQYCPTSLTTLLRSSTDGSSFCARPTMTRCIFEDGPNVQCRIQELTRSLV